MGTIQGILGCLLLLQNGAFGLFRNTHNKDIFQVEYLDEVSQPQSDEKTKTPYKVNENGTIWAVLVAGSNGYYNYRHQADICHAYQILKRNGVSEDHIITLMNDDIAYNEENPTPGIIINRPNGSDVYQGVRIDYKKDDVTPENFLAVLTGDSEKVRNVGTGRVLRSGPHDHVFINFADHGAPGLVAFPNEELHANDLIQAMKHMKGHQMYKNLVFYLEACESGSMFKNLLPAHWNIFATTAANSEESSYACYLDETRNTYLGDVYSVMWMENCDSVDLESETLQRQFLIVRNETNTSHVQEFGTKSMRNLPVADFLGESEPEKKVPLPKVELNPVDSSEVVKVLLERRHRLSTSPEERKVLQGKLKRFQKLRDLVDYEMEEILSKVTNGDEQEAEKMRSSRSELTRSNLKCYEAVAKHYSQKCFSIARNPYVTRKLYVLVNLCANGYSVDSIIPAMTSSCSHSTLKGIY